MARRKLLLPVLVGTLVGGIVYLNTPPALVGAATAPELPDDIDTYLADAERRVAAQYELIPDTEKRVTGKRRRRDRHGRDAHEEGLAHGQKAHIAPDFAAVRGLGCDFSHGFVLGRPAKQWSGSGRSFRVRDQST